jgi:hypothetical protein
VNDAVSYDGSAYIATGANTNEEPGSGSNWDLLASKGDQGPAGSGGEGGGGGFPETYVVTVSGIGTRQDSSHDTTDVWVLIAECQGGDKLLGGGYQQNPRFLADVKLMESFPNLALPSGNEGWVVAVTNSGDRTWWAWALCADTTP